MQIDAFSQAQLNKNKAGSTLAVNIDEENISARGDLQSGRQMVVDSDSGESGQDPQEDFDNSSMNPEN